MPGNLRFGAEFDAPFLAGARVVGHLVPTNVLPQVARRRKAYTGLSFAIDVERVEPSQLRLVVPDLAA
jgi:hypothetical protein